MESNNNKTSGNERFPITKRIVSPNSWKSYTHHYDRANDFIKKLDIDISCNAIYAILHQVIWHAGCDPVRWINDNNELIQSISQYDHQWLLPKDLILEIKDSLSKLQRY